MCHKPSISPVAVAGGADSETPGVSTPIAVVPATASDVGGGGGGNS